MRDISCSVDLYKPLHGSALFQRGQTQVNPLSKNLSKIFFSLLGSLVKKIYSFCIGLSVQLYRVSPNEILSIFYPLQLPLPINISALFLDRPFPHYTIKLGMGGGGRLIFILSSLWTVGFAVNFSFFRTVSLLGLCSDERLF